MTSVSSTVISVGGTPTIFLPLPTPYPSEEGCGTNVYQLTSTAPTFLAWDPVYGQSVTDATSCFPPQVTTWWLQSSSALIYTALGPSFACPEAYSTVSTNYVASSVQEVYCCPTSFTLLYAQPNQGEAFPSQCTSMLTEGQTLSWFTGVTSSTSRSTTTVFTSAATMFAVPVNGFNIDTSSQAGSTDTAAAGTAQTTASSSSSSPSSSSQSSSASSAGSSNLGLSIGVTLGVVLGILLLGVGAFVLWRRRRAKLLQKSQHNVTRSTAASQKPSEMI
ncbi:hypothetical protein J7T55_000005 [Diaporthe amygdali]|uniref:uncharacterized protein n=1 Tax=Phomopsis amygdali TaxID=1214568 RepID=UPI0022FE5C3C|nr:uncharacterized protein J7T55_000005 [Diaporthe amygdali]KAJ0107743.1 hypothetical protein J7T55_000005 [Diaporthe amygdali]